MPRNILLSLKTPAFLRQLAVNTASMSITQGGRVILNVLLSLLVANQLGVNGLGKYAILTAYLVFFQELVNAGVPRLIVREVARQKEDTSRWFSQSILNQFIAGTLGMILLWAITGLLSYDSDVIFAIRIATLVLLPYAFVSAVEAFLQAGERMYFITLIQLSARSIQLVGSAILLWLDYGIVSLAWMMVLGQVVAAIVAFAISFKSRYWDGFHFESRASLNLFRQAFEFNLLQLSVIIYSKLDIFVLSLFVDEAMVGIYSAAWLVIQAINVLANGFSAAIYPILSRTYTESLANFKRILWMFLRMGFIAALLLAIAVFLFAGMIISIPFPDRSYIASVPLLKYLSPFIVVMACNAIMANGLFASNNQHFSVIVSTVKLVFGVFLYWFLIQEIGLEGAAVATVLAGLVGTVLNSYYLRRTLWTENYL